MGNQNNNKKECLRKFSKQKGNNKEKNNLEYQEETAGLVKIWVKSIDLLSFINYV